MTTEPLLSPPSGLSCLASSPILGKCSPLALHIRNRALALGPRDVFGGDPQCSLPVFTFFSFSLCLLLVAGSRGRLSCPQPGRVLLPHPGALCFLQWQPATPTLHLGRRLCSGLLLECKASFPLGSHFVLGYPGDLRRCSSGNSGAPALPLSHWGPGVAALITVRRKAPKDLSSSISPSLKMEWSLSPPSGQCEELVLSNTWP